MLDERIRALKALDRILVYACCALGQTVRRPATEYRNDSHTETVHICTTCRIRSAVHLLCAAHDIHIYGSYTQHSKFAVISLWERSLFCRRTKRTKLKNCVTAKMGIEDYDRMRLSRGNKKQG